MTQRNNTTWRFVSKRPDTPDGFRFLPVPWWWRILHPFNARTTHAKVARIAWMLRHEPKRLDAPQGTARLQWQIDHYPIYWLLHGLKTTGKRILGLGIIWLFVLVPFLIGVLVGGHLHFTVTVGR